MAENPSQVQSMMFCSLDSNMNLNGSNYQSGDNMNLVGAVTTGNNQVNTVFTVPNHLSAWGFYQDYYYPYVIRESYPVYLQERAKDKGKQAFELIKMLKDKKLVNLEKVSDFIDLMDELIKIL